MIGAIRRAKCHLKAWPALTTEEQARKRTVYRFAQQRNLIVIDNGDRCYLQGKGLPEPSSRSPIILADSVADVNVKLEECY